MKCIKCRKEIPDGSLYCNFCGKKQSAVPSEKKTVRRGNGLGSVYKRGNVWQIELTLAYHVENDGTMKRIRRTKSGFKTKKEAVEYIPILMQKKEERSVPSIYKIYQSWSETVLPKLSKSKQTAYQIAFKKLDDIVLYSDITNLTIDDLQKNVDHACPTFYPARDMKSLLSHLFKRAMIDQHISSNLAEYIVLPELQETKQEAFTDEEIESLWADYATGNTFSGYILLMIYTGMMPGELLAVKKDQIDWENQLIIGAGLKTKKRKETPIYIADFILPVLKALCEYRPESKRVFYSNEKIFRRLFDETLKRCKCRPLKPYNCRHTTATALASNNVSPSVISEIMRHVKFETTKRYIHTEENSIKKAVNELKHDDETVS